MTLSNKQQFVICEMVNADPSYVPENESEEAKEYRKSLVAEADALEKKYDKRPIYEIPIDPWEEDEMHEEIKKAPIDSSDEEDEPHEIVKEKPLIKDVLAYYKAREFETLTYCELNEFREAAILRKERELAKKVLNRMRFLSKAKVTKEERISAAYL